MSVTETRGVRVAVQPRYLPEESDPDNEAYLFAYQITVENRGDETVTLRRRHWIITDGNGAVREVKGEGVVGEQPRLEVGEGFQYTSACPLETVVGVMEGSFTMELDSGACFEARIAPFRLAIPGVMN